MGLHRPHHHFCSLHHHKILHDEDCEALDLLDDLVDAYGDGDDDDDDGDQVEDFQLTLVVGAFFALIGIGCCLSMAENVAVETAVYFSKQNQEGEII